MCHCSISSSFVSAVITVIPVCVAFVSVVGSSQQVSDIKLVQQRNQNLTEQKAAMNPVEATEEPKMCANVCGFFAYVLFGLGKPTYMSRSASFSGMCSKCYKQRLLEAVRVPQAPAPEPLVIPTPGLSGA